MLKLIFLSLLLSVHGGTERGFTRMDIYQPEFHQDHKYRDSRSVSEGQRDSRSVRVSSPALEVFMHLPPQLRSVGELKTLLGVRPERVRREDNNNKRLVDVRSYEISQFNPNQRAKREKPRTRQKRQIPTPTNVQSKSMKLEDEPVFRDTLIEMPEAIRGPIYTTYPDGTVDVETDLEMEDPRKRRNTSANDHDDTNGRDKRTFGDVEGTTKSPTYWMRKTEKPTFITGREGRVQKGGGYSPPQHRGAENARESHSMKDLDKTVQSNEIPRNNQDNYYSSTNRRTYNSRQAENAPKSVYDTLENTPRRRPDTRTGFSRNIEEPRQNYENYYTRNHPRTYYYPYPGDVLSRGVEYYHRTYDPANGRIIYYANMPENGRNYYDGRSYDPTGRSYYVNGRTYVYDPYGRGYVQPFDYPRGGEYRGAEFRGGEYRRGYQEGYGGDKIPRDARYDGRFDDRFKDDFRNKTYVIYDADDSRGQYPRAVPTYLTDTSRYGYPAPPSIAPPVPPTNLPYPQPPPQGPYQGYQYRNQYYPPPGPWGSRPLVGLNEPHFSTRGYKPHSETPLPHPLPSQDPTRRTIS